MKLSILVNLIKDLFGSGNNVRYAESPEISIGEVKKKLQMGDEAGAQALCLKILASEPNHQEAVLALRNITHAGVIRSVQQRFPGMHYLNWLEWFHAMLKPETYLEIGVESGQSLQYAKSPTRAVGVDPALRVVHSQTTWSKFFALTSDDFFAQQEIAEVFGKSSIDFAFIDGLHTFDQALRDFINVERYSSPRTVVVFHDIFPVIPETAKRERETDFWVGDTWKVMLILAKNRPDLNIFTIPTMPSGLGVVTGLDKNSSLLSQNFESLYGECMSIDVNDYLADMEQILRVVPNEPQEVQRRLPGVDLC